MTNSQTIAASEARNNFSDLVSKVQYKGETFLIERYGEVVAKIVPVEKVAVEIEEEKVVIEQKTEQPIEQIGQKIESSTEQPEQKAQNDWKQKLDEQLSQMNRMSSLHNPHRQVHAQPVQPREATSGFEQSSQVGESEEKTQDNAQTTSQQTEQQKDSRWSALRELERLIAAQRAKSTQNQSTTNVQTLESELRQEGEGDERDEKDQASLEQTAQAVQPQQIIRKKIEL